MITLVLLLALQDVDAVRTSIADVEKRIPAIQAQLEALPTDSALYLLKAEELNKLREELKNLRVRLGETTPADVPRVRVKELRLLESAFATAPRAATLAEGESLYVRLTLEGLYAKDSQISFAIDMKVSNPDGTVRSQRKDMSRGEVEDQYGSGTFCVMLGMGNIRGILGKVALEITARDRHSAFQDVGTADLEFRKAELGLYNAYWSADPAGENEIPGLFRLSGQRFIQYKVLGFTAEAGRVHLRDGFQILDGEKKVLYSFESSKAGVKGNAPENWLFTALRRLNIAKPGRYVIRLFIEDMLTGKRAERDIPFRVLPDGGSEY